MKMNRAMALVLGVFLGAIAALKSDTFVPNLQPQPYTREANSYLLSFSMDAWYGSWDTQMCLMLKQEKDVCYTDVECDAGLICAQNNRCWTPKVCSFNFPG
jgi:hypothetical protein